MKSKQHNPIHLGKPQWLRKKLPTGPQYEQIKKLLNSSCLTTVCKEAQCPNQFECYSKGTATFMILGDKCTRDCMFCAVDHGPSSPPDSDEPFRVARAVSTMKLQYSVITSVTRDDIADGGASHFVQTINEIRKESPQTLIEILIPDLLGNWSALAEIVESRPDVLNHNVETVPRLYSKVRPQAKFNRSIDLLGKVKEIDDKMVTKSGIMLGLGESENEIQQVLKDLLHVGCNIVTLGQYLQPSRNHLPVMEFVHPDTFEKLREMALTLGFAAVASGPSVRSSYEAEKLFTQARSAIDSL